MGIKEIVRDDNIAEFEYFRENQLWYKVMYTKDDFLFGEIIFPVPIEDIGDATFNRTERAMLMMRYIRKHLKTLEEVKDVNEDI